MKEDLFARVTCPFNNQTNSVCLSQQCQSSPFVCLGNCKCFLLHNHQCNIKSLDQIDQDIKTILKFQFFIVYSPTYRGSSISVAGRYAIQTLSPHANQRFALTYDPIPHEGDQTISFRLSSIKGCVGVGIFVRQILVKNEYRFIPDQNFINHGAYMIISNNMLYSHSNSNHNGKSVKKYNVQQKDIIKVRYRKGRVSFIKNYLEQQMEVECKPDLHLHFGVYLYDVQDEVEIVNTFVQGQ